MILAAITTCRRAPAMVERALRSVIAQTYTDWDCVVVDDSPAEYELRDDVRRMVEGYAAQDKRIHYLPHDKNRGVSAARNTALEFAVERGHDFIAYLDDDDEWLPEKLEKQLARFNECGENVGLVYCGFYLWDDIKGTSREVKKSFSGDDVRKELMRYSVLGSPSFVLIRTKCIAEYGGFDTEIFSGIEDWDMWTRITQKYDATYVDMPLVNYHLGHTQRGEPDSKEAQTARIMRNIRDTLHILEKNKEYFARNKYAHWVRLEGLALGYRRCGEWRKSIGIWFKAVSLQPQRVLGNLRMLFRIIIPVGAGPLWKIRELLQKIFPERVYWTLSSFYRKVMRKFF